MDIVEIKSFLAVIEYRSFTIAAKRVHISQSAMSKRIQKIENELGVRLFIVNGSKIALTDAAKHFIPHARQMLATYNNMLSSYKDESLNFQHHIIVGATVFVSHYVLPKYINYLKTSKLPIKIHIKTMGENDYENYLNHGVVDLVICPGADAYSKSLTKIKLWQEIYYLVVSKDHELAQLKRPVLLPDLATVHAILTEKGASIRDNIDALFQENHLKINLGFEISTIDAIKTLVEYGLGWSILPKIMISDRLKILNADTLNLPVNFNAFYLKKRAEDRDLNNFLQLFNKWQNPTSSEDKVSL